MSLPDCFRSHWVKNFLNLKGNAALCLGYLAVLLVAAWPFVFSSETAIDTHGWEVTDLIEHLQDRGLHLHVIPGDGPCNHAYLTEDAEATWEAAQQRMATPERIGQWKGTVWVVYDYPGFDGDYILDQWGKNGCRIGTFLLFGDERLLRRIQEACRPHSDGEAIPPRKRLSDPTRPGRPVSALELQRFVSPSSVPGQRRSP